MRRAGDNDSTAVKAPDDQLAARRASRGKHPRARGTRPGAGGSQGAAPIDPSLGTGLIDNIICEPEEGEDHRAVPADDVLDRYGRTAADNATQSDSAPGPTASQDRLADDELDEIELQFRLQHTQPISQAAAVGPRGTADLAPDVRQLRIARRRGVPQPVSRRQRLGAQPLAVAILAVAAMVAGTVAVVQPGGSSHRAPSLRPNRILKATAGAIATVTPAQLTTAAALRALVAINAEKAAGVGAAAKERRARAEASHRRAARRAKARAAARAAAATHAARATITSTSPISEPQPTADGGSATAISSSTSQPATAAAPAGPTGGIGSLTGGCTPQC